MEIKIAREKDRKQLIEYFKHYKNKKLAEKRVNCYIKHNSTIIARDNRKIIGVLQWYVKEDPNAGVAEFEEMFVNKECRGKGVGLRLVERGIKEVKKFFQDNKIKPRKIYLFVSKDNVAARKLYEKFGFKFIAELNDLFKDNKKELFYCLEFRFEGKLKNDLS